MYGCESWTVKKAERQRIDAFELWCWRTLESPLDWKEIQLVHHKGGQSWVFIGRIDAEAETPVLWPPHVKSWLIGKDWCWEGLGAGGEGDDRGWDGWMASLTRCTWVWVNSGQTGRPGMLWFMGSQSRNDSATELNWTDSSKFIFSYIFNCLENFCWKINSCILVQKQFYGQWCTGISIMFYWYICLYLYQ